MLKDFMENGCNTHQLSFGKFRGQFVSDVSPEWAIWWMSKREHDENSGNPDIDPEHRIYAERKHQFDRTYLFLAYHLNKLGFGKRVPAPFIHTHGSRELGSGYYNKLLTRFWKAIEEGTSFQEERRAKDEIEAFFYAVWSDSQTPKF
jgi:hypothetical protein